MPRTASVRPAHRRAHRRAALRAVSAVALALALAGLPPGVARAECAVDVLKAQLSRDLEARRERVWIYAEAEPLPCRSIRLPVDAGAELVRAKVRLRRGDRRDSRLGHERLRLSDDGGGGLELQIAVPELQPGEVLALDLRWRLAPREGLSWRPGVYGPAARPTLRISRGARRSTLLEAPPPDAILAPERAAAGAVSWLIPSRWGPPRAPVHAGVAVHLDLRPAGPGGPTEPPSGRERRAIQVPMAAGEGAFFPWPAGSTDRSCTATGGAAAHSEPMGCRLTAESDGLGAVSIEQPLSVTWDFTAAAWPGSPVTAASLTVSIDGAPLACAPGQPCLATALGLAADRGGPLPVELRLEADPQRPADAALRGWLWAVGGVPALNGPARLSELSARAALLASVPEPGLPLSLKHLSADTQPLPELCAAVTDWLEAQVQVAPLPGQRPATPRPLLRVRQEGVATDWELSLLLARHLRQLRVNATPLLLRPGPEADPASPFGWTAGVVEVDWPEGVLLIAPGCGSCGPGELPAALWGAEVLGPTPRRLPPAPPGHLAWTLQPSAPTRAVELTLSGPPAQALRAALAAVPKPDRAAWLDGQLPGGRLEDHAGLDQPGAPITLRWHIPGGPLPLPALPSLEGRAPAASAHFSLINARMGCPASEGEEAGPPPCVREWALPAEATDADRRAVEAEWRAAQAPPPAEAGPFERLPPPG